MILYQSVAKAIALRANQIVGGAYVSREAAYAGASVAAVMDGIEMPHAALRANILAVEKELAEMVGNSSNSLFRSSLAARSGNVADKGAIPPLDTNSHAFIGEFDGIFDSLDNTSLTEQPSEIVIRRIENTDSFFRIPAYYYCFEGTTIRHTRPNVYLKGCSWDFTTQAAAYDNLGSSPLPQSLEVLWICKVLAALPAEGWFTQDAAYYRDFANEKESAIIQGKTQIMNLPQIPTKTSSVNPNKD